MYFVHPKMILWILGSEWVPSEWESKQLIKTSQYSTNNLNIFIMDLFLTNTQLFTSQDVNWWTGVVWITRGLLWCFYQLFGFSFWRHPFTAEDPLLNKRIWWRNKIICISDGLRVTIFSANFHFGVNFLSDLNICIVTSQVNVSYSFVFSRRN